MPTEAPKLRTIHYLGSKLRLLGPIARQIAEVLPAGGTVCDLFAGSGTVSIHLGSTWSVLASDIQEYSRVLCNGLLNPPATLGERTKTGHAIIEGARSNPVRRALCQCLAELLEHENRCTVDAAAGRVDQLCEVMECSPLVSQQAVEEPSVALAMPWRLARGRLVEGGLDFHVASVVTRQFGGVYFSWRQAIDFDALLDEVHRMDTPDRDYYLACVLVAASDLVNTVGKHFAQRARPRKADGSAKMAVIRGAVRDRSRDPFGAFLASIGRLGTSPSGLRRHRAVRRDFEELLEDESIEFDAIYADPPYTRDHYSRYYHVLETMARHDNPSVSKTTIRSDGRERLSRGVYRLDRHQSPFCIHSRATAAFSALALGAVRRRVPLVLSYSPYDKAAGNRPRVLAAGELVDLLSCHFSTVDVCEIPNVPHRKLNLVERNVAVSGAAELLMVCRP